MCNEYVEAKDWGKVGVAHAKIKDWDKRSDNQNVQANDGFV